MIPNEFNIKIKPAEESQLDFLEEMFSPGDLTKPHHRRYDIQKRGEGVYLIAWHHNIPVGHFLLRWSGPHDDHVTRYIHVAQSAFLEAGETKGEYRKKGVATAIIRQAERLAKEKGCTHIGLNVGTDNSTAKRLYEKLGYIDWEYGEFPISWEYIDKNGNKGTETEMVIYMQKRII